LEVSEHLQGPWVHEARRRNVVVSSTITARVMREGVALLVYDAQKDYGAADSVKMQAIRSVMCAPLKGTEGLLGAIYVDRRDLLSRFVEEDLDLLSAIASQTAIAIENTLAREQLHREAAARERLGRFLPGAVVDRVLRGEIKLGGVAQEVTTLFADIRGFTPLSETTPPELVVELLNEYFRTMTGPVLQYGGTLDKYIGDSVMALFGAPDNAPEQDPINAVDCAIAMQKSMRSVNESLAARQLPAIKIGIGINTGRVVVGEIGSERLMSYTAIGDAVNLAARLESTAQPGQILVSSTTARRLKNSFALNPLPPIKVKGRAQHVSIYEVLWSE
jgi:adenylate cyclase